MEKAQKEEFLTIGQVCRIVGRDRTSLYRWEKMGLVKPLRDNRKSRFFTQADVKKLIEYLRPK